MTLGWQLLTVLVGTYGIVVVSRFFVRLWLVFRIRTSIRKARAQVAILRESGALSEDDRAKLDEIEKNLDEVERG